MHDYLLSSEWIRFAFVLGVAVSMVLYEKRHLTTGSIVVPGYIAVFLIHPLVIIATFMNALLTYWLVNHVLRRYFLLYGRTKFTILAVTSTIIQTIMLRVTPSGRWLWEADVPLFIGVGYIVPALIAHDMARQGVGKTTKSVLLAGGIVALPIGLALALDLPGVNDLAPVDGFGRLAFSPGWLPLAVVLSVAASWAVAHNYQLRSGGFVGAAFTGMFMADPWQVVAAVSVAAITYVIVAKFLMRHMILFGRRKFSSMLLVSSVIAWGCLWFGERFLTADWERHFGVGSLALTPLLLPGLLANDSQRTSPLRVLVGLVMAGTFAVTATWWSESLFTDATIHPLWQLVALASFALLFAPQFRKLGVAIGSRIPTVLPTRTRPAARPAFATAANAQAESLSTPWDVWSLRYPDAARDAETWLAAQVSRFVGPAPHRQVTIARAPVTAHADAEASTATVRGEFDSSATAVLRSALERERGLQRVAAVAARSRSHRAGPGHRAPGHTDLRDIRRHPRGTTRGVGCLGPHHPNHDPRHCRWRRGAPRRKPLVETQ